MEALPLKACMYAGHSYTSAPGTACADCASLFHCLSSVPDYFTKLSACIGTACTSYISPAVLVVWLFKLDLDVYTVVRSECRYADEYVVGRARSRDPWRGAPPPPPPAARHASPRDRSPRRRDQADRYRSTLPALHPGCILKLAVLPLLQSAAALLMHLA